MVYGLVLGLAAVSGQLIGGLLIQANPAGLDWRTCYLVNVPIGIVALALTPRVVQESRAEHGNRLDLGGAALVTAALLAIVLPLVEGREHGWPLWTWLSLAAAVPLLGAFVALQRRLAAQGGSPLVDPSLFRERAFTVGLLGSIVFFAGMASFFLVFALYIQDGRGLDALGSGLIFTPLAVGYLAASIVAGTRPGKGVLALGGVTRAVGLVALALTVGAIGDIGHVALLAPALVVDGVGMGLLTAPLIATVLANMSARHAGAASGVLSTAQQIGNAVGVAVIGVVFYGALGSAPAPEDFAHAFRVAIAVIIGLALAVSVLVQLLPRAERR